MLKTPFVVLALAAGCSSDGRGGGTPPIPVTVDGILLPDAGAAVFSGAAVDNPFHPLPEGATWIFEAETDLGFERIEIEVLSATATVNGIEAVVVADAAYVDGVLVELTEDWYAQDDAGNVWYLGEETCVYEDDVCVDTEGSWEWGLDGALPGIIMPADPEVTGQPYFQEYYVGHAEDVGEVVEVDTAVSVPAGDFSGCVRTHDTSHLDPELSEYKTYCSGVGVVLIEEGDLLEELIESSLL